jgi:hypothetical protein
MTDEGPGKSLAERASLIQVTMLVQSKSPDPLPFLHGQTYEIIPGMLLPRIINPDKAWTHESTYIMAVYYGLQTREDTLRTTIGFGIVNEAYANFGVLGVLLLGAGSGAILGFVTRFALDVPMLSFRALFAFVILGLAIQLESPLSVVITAAFQSTVVLLCVSFTLMRFQATGSWAKPSLGKV